MLSINECVISMHILRICAYLSGLDELVGLLAGPAAARGGCRRPRDLGGHVVRGGGHPSRSPLAQVEIHDVCRRPPLPSSSTTVDVPHITRITTCGGTCSIYLGGKSLFKH